MPKRSLPASLLGVLCLLLAAPMGVQAQVDEGPAHSDIESHEELVVLLDGGGNALKLVRQWGLSIFSTPFNTHDGLGDGPFDPKESDPRALGQRPTLQGNGLILRTNGLDAQSCNGCHTIVSNRTRPPTLGIAGVGGIVQNALIMPSLIDVADSADDRTLYVSGHHPELPLVFDGVADFNGRLANPPFLFGGGGVELLAREMTRDLQALLEVVKNAPRGTVVALDTHGVSFGFLTARGRGKVDMSGVEGLGPENINGITPEEALVVRPFGRKGENFTMRDFDRGAMQFHFGVQPVEVVGANVDADGDGVVNEVTVGEMTALHVFDVTNIPPVEQKRSPEEDLGFATFRAIGCAGCHSPVLRTDSRFLPLAYPEVATDPSANVYCRVDLVKVGFGTDPQGSGVAVPLFADLKRHDMGDRLAESFEFGTIGNRVFTTARLWGVADTAPYLHDGRAATLYQAIEAHGGEAQEARDAFLALPETEQRALLAFLRTLRTPKNANTDLLPLP